MSAALILALRNLELGANTVAACYTRNPGNFAAALRDLAEYAEAARAAMAAAPEQADPVAEVLMHICQDHQGPIEAFSYLEPGTKLYAAPPVPAPIAQPDAWRWRWPATPEYKASPWEYKDAAPAVLAQANGDKPEIETLAVIKGAHAASIAQPRNLADHEIDSISVKYWGSQAVGVTMLCVHRRVARAVLAAAGIGAQEGNHASR